MISFLSPWILGFLALTPLLWWLLSILPPQPRKVFFPAVFLLKDLKSTQATTARSPWWLLLLRTLIICFFIVGFANPQRPRLESIPGKDGPLLIVVDNGWSAAAHWQKRKEKIEDILSLAQQIKKREVVFLTTAPSDKKEKVQGPMSLQEGLKTLEKMKPMPWSVNYAEALSRVSDISPSYTYFLSDGLDAEDKRAFLQAIQTKAGLMIVEDSDVNDPFVLRVSALKADKITFSIESLHVNHKVQSVAVRLFEEDGKTLAEKSFSLSMTQNVTDLEWVLPENLRGRAVRMGLTVPAMASSTALMNISGFQKPVGIIVASNRGGQDRNFLSESYYLRRALDEKHNVETDTVKALISKEKAVIVWPDTSTVTEQERVQLQAWIEKGGTLIRFAGPNLAGKPDQSLLPVQLRYGQRSLGGALTWEKPQGLGPISEDSPLYGLLEPKDIVIQRQILAEATPQSFEKTWIQLKDGTPLVTGQAQGKGKLILIHTTAGPDWSNLCYSGLYVDMLEMIMNLSQGVSAVQRDGIFSPQMVMDAFGILSSPTANEDLRAIDVTKPFTFGPHTPPGIYGQMGQFRIFNLSDKLAPMKPFFKVPLGAVRESYQVEKQINLKTILITIAIYLLLLDTMITLWMQGVIKVRQDMRMA